MSGSEKTGGEGGYTLYSIVIFRVECPFRASHDDVSQGRLVVVDKCIMSIVQGRLLLVVDKCIVGHNFH